MNGKKHTNRAMETVNPTQQISDTTAFIKLMSDDRGLFEERLRIEEAEKWLPICEHIPVLQFPTNWKIKILPPYLGVIVRYHVELRDIQISVILDFFERCGVNSEKKHSGFWEIMRISTPNSDIRRYQKDDTKGLINGIQELLGEGVATL